MHFQVKSVKRSSSTASQSGVRIEHHRPPPFFSPGMGCAHTCKHNIYQVCITAWLMSGPSQCSGLSSSQP